MIQDRRIPLHPAPDRDVVNRKVPLGHDLFEIAVGERISQIPADAQQDDHVFEMPSPEQCWSSSGHDTPYQISSTRIRNRAVRRPYYRSSTWTTGIYKKAARKIPSKRT